MVGNGIEEDCQIIGLVFTLELVKATTAQARNEHRVLNIFTRLGVTDFRILLSLGSGSVSCPLICLSLLGRRNKIIVHSHKVLL